MALFGNSDSGTRLPEYRVAALASLDLEEHLKEKPLQVDRPGHIEWMVTEDDDGYLTARGAIRIPVELYFEPAEEGDPVLERIVVNGKRRFDTRVEEVAEDEEVDGNYGIDEISAMAQSHNNYRRTMRS